MFRHHCFIVLEKKTVPWKQEQCRVVDFIMSMFRLLVDVFLIVWVLCCGHSGIKTVGCIVKCCDPCFKLGHTTVNVMIGRICVWKFPHNSGKISVTNKYSVNIVLL